MIAHPLMVDGTELKRSQAYGVIENIFDACGMVHMCEIIPDDLNHHPEYEVNCFF
jgi:hypothetical protein